jgi:hypothetical protein
MQIKTNFQQKIEGHKRAVYRLKKLSVHALLGLCTLSIFEYEISLYAGNLEIITGSLCLDMATLSIGADLCPGPLLYCTQEQYSSLMNPPLESEVFI